MNIKLLHKKWFRAVLITLAGVILLSTVFTIVIRSVLKNNNISYSDLTYRFPATLYISELSIHRSDSLMIDVGQLEAEWKWMSLIKRKPELTHLLIGDAEISLVSTENETSKSEGFSLPSLSLNDISLRNVRLDMGTETDTIKAIIPELYLSSASYDEQLEVDSLVLSRTGLFISTHSIDTARQEKAGQSFMLESFPLARINHVAVSDGAVRFNSPSAEHKIENLNLAFSGWNRQDLAGFSIERLGLNYQDTLDLKLVPSKGDQPHL